MTRWLPVFKAGSGERADVSRRSSRAESWAGSVVMRFVDGSRSTDKFVGMWDPALRGGSTTISIVLRAV